MTREFAINEAARRTEVLESDHFVYEVSVGGFIVTDQMLPAREHVAKISFIREYPRLRMQA